MTGTGVTCRASTSLRTKFQALNRDGFNDLQGIAPMVPDAPDYPPKNPGIVPGREAIHEPKDFRNIPALGLLLKS